MKKIFYLLTLLGIFVGVYSSYALISYDFDDDQKQMNCEEISFSNKKMKDASVIEEQSTEEENIDVQVVSSGMTNYRDDYEDNESIETATYISPIDFYNLDEYYVEIDANLDTVAMIVDVDYYYFVVLSESVVSITSTSNTVLESFDFNIYTYEYGTITNNTVNRNIVEIYSDYTENGTKSYSATLETGTYLIYMRGHQAYNSDIAIEYTLTLDVELVPFEQSVTTDSMLSSEYEGAIWVSDFVPGNYIPLLNLGNDILFYQYNVSGIDTPEYSLEIMRNIIDYEYENEKLELAVQNNLPFDEDGYRTDYLDINVDGEIIEGVHVATYYLWNTVLRHVMYLASDAMYKEYKNTESEIRGQIESVELIHDTSENVLSVVCDIVGGYVETIYHIPYASDILEYVSISALNYVFDILTPSIDDVENGLAFYTRLCDVLSMGITNQYVNDYDYINSLNNEGIVYIPIYYNIIEMPLLNKVYLSYSATTAYVSHREYYPQLKTNVGNTIYCDQEFDYFDRGKIYGLEEFGAITSTDNLNLYDENYHVHDYTDSYIYINTTHHYAYCRCGGRIRQGHAVVGSSKTCLQCGGSVDKGFVQMSISGENIDEKTHVLDNGVVVLNEKDILSYLNGKLTLKKKDEE